MPKLWQRDGEFAFHDAITRLSKLRQTPSPEVSYREQNYTDVSEDPNYVLRFEEELQLADHLGYLAQGCEGFPEIAAVCIEEQQDQHGLIVRLARNELHPSADLSGLRNLLRSIGECSSSCMAELVSLHNIGKY